MPQGFESTGKADVYDDRIFALSALMSQVRECGAMQPAAFIVFSLACMPSDKFYACHHAAATTADPHLQPARVDP